MNATLMSTSLSYRMVLTNTGLRTISQLTISGSMVGAHVSQPMEQQLGIDGQALELLHEAAMLEPGQSLEYSGELRLPLTAITPIHSGNAVLFIPLARFRAQCESGGTHAAFVVGETPPVAAAALLPFRLDLGPRIWTRVSARRLDPPAA